MCIPFLNNGCNDSVNSSACLPGGHKGEGSPNEDKEVVPANIESVSEQNNTFPFSKIS